jgi:hypothetical protein
MVDAINVTGDRALVTATIGTYRRAGVDVPVVFPLTWGSAGQDALDSTLRAAIAVAGLLRQVPGEFSVTRDGTTVSVRVRLASAGPSPLVRAGGRPARWNPGRPARLARRP